LTPWRPWSGPARVALVAPAGALPEGMAAVALERLEALGLEVRPGRHLAARDGPWAGTLAERLQDLSWAMTDDEIDAVWLARGGEGTAAVAAALPWRRILRRPRPVVGMSDATFLHGALGRRGIPSVHGAMCGVDGWNAFAAAAALGAVAAPPPWPMPLPEGFPAPRPLRAGRVEAPVVGGNLTCLAAAVGTPLMPPTRGRILLMEDVSEAAYRIDRCLTQLAQAGALRDLAGVLLGTFTDCGPSGGLTVDDVLERHLAPLGVPVLAGVPLGHGAVQSALPLGVRCRLDAVAGRVTVVGPVSDQAAAP
jgi:muramoyltetrapeptide carboxypeptidase